jgi:transcriptional regulator with XRE-family HTH domain
MTARQIIKLMRHERQKQGLTASELAVSGGMSYTTVSKWERGETAATLGNLIAVLHVLGLELVVRRDRHEIVDNGLCR